VQDHTRDMEMAHSEHGPESVWRIRRTISGGKPGTDDRIKSTNYDDHCGSVFLHRCAVRIPEADEEEVKDDQEHH
jgi:hypothetical protein